MSYPKNKTGLAFGSYFRTSAGHPGRVAGPSNRMRTFCEVWGVCQECGDIYTNTLQPITKEQFEHELKAQGYDPMKNPSRIENLRKFDKEQTSP